MIPAVSEGQYDIGMTGITITDERKEQVDFSDPYMRSEMLMIVRGDEARFTDAASFAADPDLLISAQPGTSPFYAARLRDSGRQRGKPPHHQVRDLRRRA
jgi:polar amino acid transport system substrate-binding protein